MAKKPKKPDYPPIPLHKKDVPGGVEPNPYVFVGMDGHVYLTLQGQRALQNYHDAKQIYLASVKGPEAKRAFGYSEGRRYTTVRGDICGDCQHRVEGSRNDNTGRKTQDRCTLLEVAVRYNGHCEKFTSKVSDEGDMSDA